MKKTKAFVGPLPLFPPFFFPHVQVNNISVRNFNPTSSFQSGFFFFHFALRGSCMFGHVAYMVCEGTECFLFSQGFTV